MKLEHKNKVWYTFDQKLWCLIFFIEVHWINYLEVCLMVWSERSFGKLQEIGVGKLSDLNMGEVNHKMQIMQK